MQIPPSMGLATAINFQPTGGGKAAITGDFVLTADEVNPVIRAPHRMASRPCRSTLTCSRESAALLHAPWANDDASNLATGLRAALDATKSQKPATR
jgi:hypothetical protein